MGGKKVAYLVEWEFSRASGVERKILNQCRVWIELNYKVSLFILGPKINPEYLDSIRSKGINVVNLPTFRAFGAGNLVIKTLYAIYLSRYFKKRDFSWVLYRISGLNPGMLVVSRLNRMFIEVNSKFDSGAYGFGIYRRILNKYYSLLFRDAKGLVFITQELKDYFSLQFGLNQDKLIVSPNGYYSTNSSYFQEDKISKNHSLPTMLFIGGHNHEWNGYDKVIKLANYLPEYRFIVIGSCNVDSPPSNVEMYSKVEGDDLIDIYKKVHIGIGTLALHRKNMTQASPLKVREYIYHGLPVIIAYDDELLGDSKLVYKLENREGSLDANSAKEIRNFVKFSWKKTITTEIRQRNDLYQIEKTKITKFDSLKIT